MATVREFSLGCSKTINLGNYQSIRIEASVTISLDSPQDSVDDAMALAQEELRHLLEETYRAQYKQAQSLV